jgi:hypothetical protein
MEILGQAFQLRETAPVDLPSVRFFLSSTSHMTLLSLFIVLLTTFIIPTG